LTLHASSIPLFLHIVHLHSDHLLKVQPVHLTGIPNSKDGGKTAVLDGPAAEIGANTARENPIPHIDVGSRQTEKA